MSRAELKPHGASSGCSQHSRSRLGHKRLSTALLHMPSQQPPGPARAQTLGSDYWRKRGSGGHESTFKPQSAWTCLFGPFLVP